MINRAFGMIQISIMDGDQCDFLRLPFQQQGPVQRVTQPDRYAQRSQTRKRSRDDVQSMVASSIQESLTDETMCDPVSFGGSIAPLPGFDDNLPCKLCQIRTCDDLLQMKPVSEGATLAEFLQVAHTQFDQEEGRPSMDVAKEINEALTAYSSQCNIALLQHLTDEEVYRHFKYDHRRHRKPQMKDKMLRILMSMLDTSVRSCCEKSENGKVIISKSDASLTLNIIDRIHKIATLKELD